MLLYENEEGAEKEQLNVPGNAGAVQRSTAALYDDGPHYRGPVQMVQTHGARERTIVKRVERAHGKNSSSTERIRSSM